VVEGVETVGDYEAVSALGQPAVQGYFIAKPMSEAELLSWIAEHSKADFTSARVPASK